MHPVLYCTKFFITPFEQTGILVPSEQSGRVGHYILIKYES